MDMRLYAEDVDGGLRSANRVGGNAAVIAKARIAVIKKAANAKAHARRRAGRGAPRHRLHFQPSQWLRRADKTAEAGALILSLPRDPPQAIDTDQWWIERRLVARKLLDLGDAKTAYRVARDAAIPSRDNYRIEHQFTAGWIALRFLNDPSTAQAHFAKVGEGVSNPISLARAGYWQGRAAEALGQTEEARAHYEAAAHYPTAYYGQIARARLGYKDIVLRPPPARPIDRPARTARAAELLYAIDERDLVLAIWPISANAPRIRRARRARRSCRRHKDARAMLLLGKGALGRGLPLDQYAFPTVGIPDYRAIGPAIEPSVVYAIARQESTFNPRTVSSARPWA